MNIKELWNAYNENLNLISLHRDNLKTIKKEIEVEVAKEFGIEQALMSSIFNCPKSPTQYCFADPNSGNPWKCLYCDFDRSQP